MRKKEFRERKEEEEATIRAITTTTKRDDDERAQPAGFDCRFDDVADKEWNQFKFSS